MRVTFALAQQKIIRDIGRKAEDMDRLSTSVTSGKRLLRASDDPMAWAQAMDFKQGLRELETFQKNMDFATGWNQVSESAMEGLSDALMEAKDLAIASVKPTSSEERHARAVAMEKILDEALALAGTRYGDRYVFSGLTNPSSDPPFTMETSVDAGGNEVVAATYHGDDGELKVRTGKGANNALTVNIPGEALFTFDEAGTTRNVFEEIHKLKEAIGSENTTAIEDGIARLELAQENLMKQRSVVGSRLAGLERQQDALDALGIDQQTRLAEIEEADMPEVITQLQQKRTIFEATLRVTAMLNDLNLSKFL